MQMPLQPQLKLHLNAFDLILLGIGAIVGAGIFVVTGIAAATKAGPSIILSFGVAAIACTFTALSYAELAASLGGCGSAYGYTFTAIGRFFAWIIGWDLLLEYGISSSAVAVGWSGYTDRFLHSVGFNLPPELLKSPFAGGLINLPAVFIVLLITFILIMGIKESARFNAFVVWLKLAVILIFIVVASVHINPDNWHPFMPFGWSGVMQGAALIFFSYIGFDAVSTAAEETINPQRNLPIGIIGSLIVCTILYIVVSAVLTGVVPYQKLNVVSPIADALLHWGRKFMAGFISVGAIAGLTSVVLVMFYGLTRVFLAITRDGLLPKNFAVINPNTHTPIRIILFCGILIALTAGFVPIESLVEMVNIGTLSAFAIVSLTVIILRYKQPHRYRPFKAPWSPLTPILGILSCLYLIFNLTPITWLRFLIWMILGFIIYFFYSRHHAKKKTSDIVL